MFTFLISPRWQITLWQARARERLAWVLLARYQHYIGAIPDRGESRYAAFVDRVSPFSATGYARTPLRKALWAIRFPRRWSAYTVTRLAHRVSRSWPHASSRFAGWSEDFALKAQYVYDEHDWTMADGDVTEWAWFGAWLDIDVPWSGEPEHWFFVVDQQGFISAYTGTRDAMVAFFDAYERDWLGFNDDESMTEDEEARQARLDQRSNPVHEEDHYGD